MGSWALIRPRDHAGKIGEESELPTKRKRKRGHRAAWLKAVAVGLAAAVSIITAASQGSHDSGAVTGGPSSCIVIGGT
jgi:hypothetical protein